MITTPHENIFPTINQEYNSGMTPEEISKKLKVSIRFVRARLGKILRHADQIDQNLVAELYRQGKTMEEIAGEIGWSAPSVWKALFVQGLAKRRVKRNYHEIKALWNDGLSRHEISEKLKIPYRTVCRYTSKATRV